jgi:hypothetical protein
LDVQLNQENQNVTLGLRGSYSHCPSEHFFYSVNGDPGLCPLCGQAGKDLHAMLFPRFGYTTAAWDPPRRAVKAAKIGGTQRATVSFNAPEGDQIKDETFAGVPQLLARYKENGELLAYNPGAKGFGFAVCLKCGFAAREKAFGKGSIGLPKEFLSHISLYKSNPKDGPCWRTNAAEAPVLRNQSLSARQTTDVLLVDPSLAAKDLPPNNARAFAHTLGYALQVSGAKLLEIDSRELAVIVVPAGKQGDGYGPVIYDNVPGGAGHVRELMSYGRDWLKAARDTMFVSEQHHRRCDDACIECLLTFDAQHAMADGLLHRREAITHLDNWLNS